MLLSRWCFALLFHGRSFVRPAGTRQSQCICFFPHLRKTVGLESSRLSSSAEVLLALLPASSHPLWSRFLELILASLLHLTSSPITELEYIAEALWPLYTSALPPHLEQDLLGKPYPDPDKPPPALVANIKLLTDLKHALAVPLAVAAEDLLTRRVGVDEFRETMRRPVPGTPSRALARASQAGQGLVADLALCGKYLVVAGYCASYNPAKSDQRLFGRIGADGKKRRGGGNRRAGYGRMRVGKVRGARGLQHQFRRASLSSGSTTPAWAEAFHARPALGALRVPLRRTRHEARGPFAGPRRWVVIE